MKEQRRVYEALAQARKEELSSEKVELSVVGDLKAVADDMQGIAIKVYQSIKDLQDIANAFKRMKADAKSIYKEGSGLVKRGNQAAKASERIIKAAEAQAKDLGVKPTQIEGMNDAKGFQKGILDAIRAFERAEKDVLAIIK